MNCQTNHAATDALVKEKIVFK